MSKLNIKNEHKMNRTVIAAKKIKHKRIHTLTAKFEILKQNFSSNRVKRFF